MRPNPETVGIGPIIARGYTDGNLDYETFIDGANIGVFSYKRTYTGTTTPGYWTKKRLRQALPRNSYSTRTIQDSGTRYEQVITTYDWLGTFPNYHYGEISSSIATVSNTCGFAPGTGNDPSHIVGASYIAERRLREKTSGMAVNLAQAFGERKQTAKLISNSSERLFQAMHAIKKGNLKLAADKLGIGQVKLYNRFGRQVGHSPNREIDVGNVWLEYKYGWKPLMQDIKGSIDLLTRKMTLPDGMRVSATGRAYEENRPPPGNYPKWSQLKTTLCKLAFTFKLEDEADLIASASGVNNPALLAWELIPYSFVWDWLMPVGDYLERLTAYDGFKLSHGTISNMTTGTYVADYSYHASVGAMGISRCQVSYARGIRQQKMFSYDRSSISMPPIETPTFRNPIGGNFLDRFATAASLVRQFIPSERKKGSTRIR